MKKLFREIKEKWEQYLMEIIVIIIGILVAFLLNSWNANVRSQHERAELVKNLHDEFESNLESLEDQISRLDRKINACKKMVICLHPIDPPIAGSEVDTLVRRLYDVPTWNPSTYVLSELKNTGQLKSLKDQKLKRLLYKWEQHYENLKEWYELEKDLYARLYTVMTEEGSARNAVFKNSFGESPFGVDNKHLFMSPTFENELMHTMMVAGGLQSIYQRETLDLIHQILDATKQE